MDIRAGLQATGIYLGAVHGTVPEDGSRFSFKPVGEAQLIQLDGSGGCLVARNPGPEDYKKRWRERKALGSALATKFICGLNVGKKPVWTPRDLWYVLAQERQALGLPQDSTLITTEGLWSSEKFGIVNETSAQVVVLDFD